MIINILSAVIYTWCLYTIFFNSYAYADYMGIPKEPEADDSGEAGDAGADDGSDAAESEEDADQTS